MIRGRDVAVLAARLDGIAAGQKRLEGELAAHRAEHREDRKQVGVTRRWRWTIGVAAGGAVLSLVLGIIRLTTSVH